MADSPQQSTSEDGDSGAGLQLRKTMGMWHGVSVIFGSVVGSGIFISPNQVINSTGSIGATLLIWALCGLLVAFGALQYMELGCAMPSGAGGDYEYLHASFGSLAAFAFSFSRLALVVPAALAVAGLSLGNYLLNKNLVNKMQLVFGIGKASALILVILCGIYGLTRGGGANFEDAFAGTSGAWSVVNGFYGCIFTYAGWNLPRAASIAIGMIAVLYILVNVAYFALLTKSEILSSNAVAVDALQKIGRPLAIVISLLVSLSVFGFINSMLFTSSRVVYSAALNSHMPAFLSYLHCKNETPIPSVTAVTVISLLFMAVGSISSLVYTIAFCESIFLVLTFLGFIVLRFKRPDMKRPFKAFLPLVLIFGLSMIFIAIVGLAQEYKYSLICLGAILAAIALFLALPKLRLSEKTKLLAGKCLHTAQRVMYTAAPAKDR